MRHGFPTPLPCVVSESDASCISTIASGFVDVGSLKEVGRKSGRRLAVHLNPLMLKD